MFILHLTFFHPILLNIKKQVNDYKVWMSLDSQVAYSGLQIFGYSLSKYMLWLKKVAKGNKEFHSHTKQIGGYALRIWASCCYGLSSLLNFLFWLFKIKSNGIRKNTHVLPFEMPSIEHSKSNISFTAEVLLYLLSRNGKMWVF